MHDLKTKWKKKKSWGLFDLTISTDLGPQCEIGKREQEKEWKKGIKCILMPQAVLISELTVQV